MTTLIRDILLRDPAKEGLVNNGQARITNELADEHVLAELRGELSTFVCEGQYADGIIKILSSFLASRSQTHQKSAWVSARSFPSVANLIAPPGALPLAS